MVQTPAGGSFVSVTAKELFREVCFLLHKREDLQSQEVKAIFALRQDAVRQMLVFCFDF